MENNNFLLKRKIKSDPLTIEWVDYFFANHVSEVILQPLRKDEVGSIEVTHNPENTASAMVSIPLEEFPLLKFGEFPYCKPDNEASLLWQKEYADNRIFQ